MTLSPGDATVTKLAQAVSLDRARKGKAERGAKAKVVAQRKRTATVLAAREFSDLPNRS